jgi:endonuclease/exonuclease/phosphatase family metal-dependent hydrolase
MRKWTVAFLLPLALCVGAYAQTLGVMTFNVRYPSPDDGPNVWENRRDILVETIRLKNPDLFGTQELFHKQGQYIADKLPEYTWFGISRRGNNQDEHMGVFYKPSKLRLLESGNFWLSESPDTPGSMSWDVSLPRMVTWGLFEISETGRRIYFYNTHFPHRREDAAARVECAKVIAKRMRTLPEDLPFLMTGDFNAQVGEDVYKILVPPLKDAWVETPRKSGPETTSSRWHGNTEGRRIDWILYRGNIKTLEAETVTHNLDGRYPSDHYPVFVTLEIR